MAFGETVEGYSIPVLNEREVRAGAGILLLVATIAFMNAWLVGNFNLTVLVIIGFFVEFFIRVFISPRYAPSLILGRFAVRNQKPEYTGAAQKRFAWALGLALATAMMIYVVFMGARGGPIVMLSCVTCVMLLFFESAFGICLGCVIYNAVSKDQAQLCPGDACEVRVKEPIQHINLGQVGVLAAFVAGIAILPMQMPQIFVGNGYGYGRVSAANEAERCKVPDFAKAMGHEEKWKLHNNCK